MSFIVIYDITEAANVIYASESITEVLGWEPADIKGKGAYSFVHPQDHASVQQVHNDNVKKEKMDSLVSYRFKHKNGEAIQVETVVHCCEDALVTSNFVHQPDTLHHKMRASSASEIFSCMPDGSLQREGDRLHQLDPLPMSSAGWTKSAEPRFYLILNRFTNELSISSISQRAYDIVGLDNHAIGQSLFHFIAESDAAMVRESLDRAKGNNSILRIRFDWLTKYTDSTITQQRVEAAASCTNDGIVMVIRKFLASPVQLGTGRAPPT